MWTAGQEKAALCNVGIKIIHNFMKAESDQSQRLNGEKTKLFFFLPFELFPF